MNDLRIGQSPGPSNVFSLPGILHEARATSLPPQGWARAFELVDEAAELSRAADERAHEITESAEALVQSALTELKSVQEKIGASEGALSRAERRAAEAEQRVDEAEEWLGRFQSALKEQLIERSAINREQAA